MNLHEVKIGDLVTFTTEKGKKVKGKVIHRHNDASKAHLMGHVNVQLDDEGSYPQTVHVSKLKKITEETIMEDSQNKITNFLQAVLSGENIEANTILDGLMAEKIDATLSALKVDVAQHMFATESVEHSEYISEEEFNALSPEQQAEYEMVELEEAGPVKTANKAKKGNWEYNAAQKAVKTGDLQKSNTDSPNPLKADFRSSRKDTPTSLVKHYRKGASSTDKTYAQHSKKQHASEVKRPVAYGKRENFVKMNATAKSLNKEQFAVDEAIIAPRPTPSPAATAAAKTDIEKAKKKREDALAAAKAELASTSKGDLKKALYSKMYKNEEVEQVNEVITKSTPTSEIISDFVHSKNSKFTGKNKKERIKMALGAKYAMMKKD